MSEISFDQIANIEMADLVESASRARRLDDGEERALVERWASGQEDARDELVMACLRVAVDEAIRNRGRGARQDHLARAASQALVEAAPRYDPARDGPFRTWSRHVVRGAIRRQLLS